MLQAYKALKWWSGAIEGGGMPDKDEVSDGFLP